MHVKPNHPSQAAAGRTLIGFNIIHGREVEGDLGLIESRSPVDSRDVVGLFPDSGAKDVDRAAKAAADAFPGWSRIPVAARLGLVRRLGEVLRAQQPRLTRIITREVGLTPGEAVVEVQLTLDVCALICDEGVRHLDGTAADGCFRRPLGVVGVLSSRTSPLASPFRKVLGALVCGNTVVWKPSEGAPSTAYLALQALQDAGLPPGVVNTVNGKGRGGCGKHFLGAIEKGQFQQFSFAGSVALGRHVGEICGRNLVAADLETGGKNSMIVMEDADLDAAVDAAILDAFRAAGQRSLSLGNLLLHRPIAERFQERFLAAASSLKVGNPLSHPGVAYGPLLNERFAEAFRHHWEKGAHDGARLLLGGIRWDESNRTGSVEGEIAKGAYVQPCVWGGVTPSMPLFRSEVYGPTVNLCTVDSFAEAIALANGTPHGLACSLFSRDRNRILDFQAGIRTGSLAVNAPMPVAGPWTLETWTRRQAAEGFVEEESAAEPLPRAAKTCAWEALD